MGMRFSQHSAKKRLFPDTPGKKPHQPPDIALSAENDAHLSERYSLPELAPRQMVETTCRLLGVVGPFPTPVWMS